MSNAAPTVPTIADVTRTHNQAPLTFNVNATDANAQDQATNLTYSVQVEGYNPLYDLKTQLGLTTPAGFFDFSFNGTSTPTGVHNNEYYYLSSNGSSVGAPVGGYYMLRNNNMLYAWKGTYQTTITQAPVADFTAAPYSGFGNVYNEPSLLNLALKPQVPAAAVNHDSLYDLKAKYGLTGTAGSFNFTGNKELYFLSTNGSNSTGGGYFMLRDNNMLYAWKGSFAATIAAAPVADLNAGGERISKEMSRELRPDSLMNVKGENLKILS